MRFSTKPLCAALAGALTLQRFLHVVKVYRENVAFAMGKEGWFCAALLTGGTESRHPGMVGVGRELIPCHPPATGQGLAMGVLPQKCH